MKTIHIEVIHEGEHCIPCVYMAQVVAEVAQDIRRCTHLGKSHHHQKRGRTAL